MSAGGTVTGHRGRVDGRLPVTCWCEADVVVCTADEVAAGLTRSCGRPECHG